MIETATIPTTADDPVRDALACASELVAETRTLGFIERLEFQRAWRHATGLGPRQWLRAARAGALSADDLDRLGGVLEYLDARAHARIHDEVELARRQLTLRNDRRRLQRAAEAIRIWTLRTGSAPWTSGRKA